MQITIIKPSTSCHYSSSLWSAVSGADIGDHSLPAVMLKGSFDYFVT